MMFIYENLPLTWWDSSFFIFWKKETKPNQLSGDRRAELDFYNDFSNFAFIDLPKLDSKLKVIINFE